MSNKQVNIPSAESAFPVGTILFEPECGFTKIVVKSDANNVWVKELNDARKPVGKQERFTIQLGYEGYDGYQNKPCIEENGFYYTEMSERQFEEIYG